MATGYEVSRRIREFPLCTGFAGCLPWDLRSYFDPDPALPFLYEVYRAYPLQQFAHRTGLGYNGFHLVTQGGQARQRCSVVV